MTRQMSSEGVWSAPAPQPTVCFLHRGERELRAHSHSVLLRVEPMLSRTVPIWHHQEVTRGPTHILCPLPGVGGVTLALQDCYLYCLSPFSPLEPPLEASLTFRQAGSSPQASIAYPAFITLHWQPFLVASPTRFRTAPSYSPQDSDQDFFSSEVPGPSA
jgi:hypothetical protein